MKDLPDKESWIKSIRNELNAIIHKQVHTVLERSKVLTKDYKPNIIVSRWVFKRKVDKRGKTKFKARLFI